MSLNLFVEATRTVTAVVKGRKKRVKEVTEWPLWQTPTEVTRKVLACSDNDQKVKCYLEWVHANDSPFEENVYDFDAPVDQNWNYPVIGRTTVSPAKLHEIDLKNWLQMCAEQGYNVKFTMS